MSETAPLSPLPPRRRLSPFFWPALGGAAVLAVADQLSKWLIFEYVLRVGGTPRALPEWLVTVRHWSTYGEPAEFAERTLAPFANLVMVWNRGVSFGLFSGTGAQSPYILIATATIIVAVLLAWLARLQDKVMATALSLIVGGAVANVHDRLRFGAVADFLDLHVAGYHWPAFNVADSAIVIGALLLALDAFGWRRTTAAVTNEQKG